jgi:HAD superfamily hydrolase (TIGR01450 family)
MTVSPAIRGYDAVLLDLDGCCWVGGAPTPRAPEAVAALREAGIAIGYLTNDPRSSPEGLVRKLWSLGFMASVPEVVTVGSAVQHLLAQERSGESAYVAGTQALVDHVADAGLRIANGTSFADRADVVVVSGHDDITFAELTHAIRAVLHGATLVGTARDRIFPTPDGPLPGTGAILAVVETATGRQADVVVGKPNPPMYRTSLDRLGLGPGARVLGVGDLLDVDVAGALGAGLDAALVLSGATGAAEAEAADPVPTFVAANLGELVLGAG